MPRAAGLPRLILLGRIGESVPARELANRILQRPDPVVLKARHPLGISQCSLQIPAKVIVAHHHGFDQTAFEGLADNIGQFLKAEQGYGQHPAAPDKALLLRLPRVIEPEQVGLRLVPRDPSGGREISQSRQGSGANILIRLRRLDQAFEGVEIAIVGADQDLLEGDRDTVAQHGFHRLTVQCKTAQEPERARVLLLARKVEDEEDRTRGLIRPLRSTGEALQHAEQSGGSLLPVIERPFRGFLREIIPGAREGLDRGLNVHGKARSLLTRGGAAGCSWSTCAHQMLTCAAAVQRWLCRSGCQSVPCGLPMPGQQLVKSADRRAPRDHPLEHIGQIGLRVEVVQLRRVDQARQDRPGPGSALPPGEERILPARRTVTRSLVREPSRKLIATFEREHARECIELVDARAFTVSGGGEGGRGLRRARSARWAGPKPLFRPAWPWPSISLSYRWLRSPSVYHRSEPS